MQNENENDEQQKNPTGVVQREAKVVEGGEEEVEAKTEDRRATKKERKKEGRENSRRTPPFRQIITYLIDEFRLDPNQAGYEDGQ